MKHKCVTCNYSTDNPYSFATHKKSKKHIGRSIETIYDSQNEHIKEKTKKELYMRYLNATKLEIIRLSLEHLVHHEKKLNNNE
jgi:hypothetical protein